MRSLRSLAPFLLALGVSAAGAAPLFAQEEPLAAGSEGIPVPKKTKHVQPTYPQEALAQGVRGIVILDIVVDTQGKVESTSVVRSVPGLDEAAIAAARQWEYEPTKVSDKPVRVRITVPITFALALPQLARQDGIPELRQGASPAWPAGADGGGLAAAEVTLEPDGRVGGARVLDGGAPWSDALLAALRTWRFAPPPDDAVLSFRVEAEFVSPRGSAPQQRRVTLKAAGLQRSGLLDAPATAAAAPAVSGASPEAPPATPAAAPAAAAAATPAATPAAPAAPASRPDRARGGPDRATSRGADRGRGAEARRARCPRCPAGNACGAEDHPPSSTGSPGHAATLGCHGRPAGGGDHRAAARRPARERRLGHPRRDSRAGRSRPHPGPPAGGATSRPHVRDLGQRRGVLLRQRRRDDVDPGGDRPGPAPARGGAGRGVVDLPARTHRPGLSGRGVHLRRGTREPSSCGPRPRRRRSSAEPAPAATPDTPRTPAPPQP